MAPKEKTPDLDEFPDRLRKALVKLMAAEDLDLPEALERAGLLLEKNSESYGQELQAKANTLYKSRFLSELNKARAGWEKNNRLVMIAEFEKGFNAGEKCFQEEGMVWRVPCSICGKPIQFTSNDSNFKETYEVLRQAFSSWSHVNC